MYEIRLASLVSLFAEELTIWFLDYQDSEE